MNLKKAERTSTSNRKVAETKSGRFVSIQGARAHETPADSSKFHSRKTRNVRKNHPTVDVHVSENSCQECLPPASPKTDTKARGPNKRPTLERLWNVCVNKSEVKNFPQMLDTILQSYRKLPEFVHFLASQNKFEIPYGDRRYFAKFNHAAKQIEITADEASTVSSSGLLELRSKSEEVATCDNDACVLQMPAINTNVLFRDEKLVKLQALWAAQGGSKGQTNKMVLTVNLNGDREYCLLVSLRASKDLQKGNESGLSYTFQDSQTAEWLQVHMNSFSVKGTTPNQPSYSSPAENALNTFTKQRLRVRKINASGQV